MVKICIIQTLKLGKQIHVEIFIKIHASGHVVGHSITIPSIMAGMLKLVSSLCHVYYSMTCIEE